MSEFEIRVIAAIVGALIGFGCGAYYGYLCVFKKLLVRNFYGDEIKREILTKPTFAATVAGIIMLIAGIAMITVVASGLLDEIAIVGAGIFAIVLGGIIIWGTFFGE